VKDAPVKSVQITSTEKASILLWNMPENPLNIAILPVKSPFHQNIDGIPEKYLSPDF